MDGDAVDPEMLRASLRFIRRINDWLGYTRATVRQLERFSRGWARGQTIWILDLATGSGDVPRAILRWADRKGWAVRVVGFDRHSVTAKAANDENTDRRMSILQADVFAPPFENESFDYVMTSMFLHHLSDEEAVTVMRSMGQLARRGVIVADLIRNRRAYAWATLFTAMSNPMVRHDARVSVAQAFTREEAISMGERAELGFVAYEKHFGHRFILAGEKKKLRRE